MGRHLEGVSPYRLSGASAIQIDWHTRYTQQAAWTAPLRQHLFARLGLTPRHRLLEVGCGTGAILCSLPARGEGRGEVPLAAEQHHAVIPAPLPASGERRGEVPPAHHGLDLSLPSLRQAARYAPTARLTCGDAHALPYASASFDFVICHFLLLWLAHPSLALDEMARLLRPGGWLLALAEPDYGGRLDYPPELVPPGQLQIEALRRQGADPEIGRRLGALLLGAGLQPVETGVLAGQWQCQPQTAETTYPDLEWDVLETDIRALAEPARLDAWRAVHRAARRQGSRLTFVPTFYALGQRPPATQPQP